MFPTEELRNRRNCAYQFGYGVNSDLSTQKSNCPLADSNSRELSQLSHDLLGPHWPTRIETSRTYLPEASNSGAQFEISHADFGFYRTQLQLCDAKVCPWADSNPEPLCQQGHVLQPFSVQVSPSTSPSRGSCNTAYTMTH